MKIARQRMACQGVMYFDNYPLSFCALKKLSKDVLMVKKDRCKRVCDKCRRDIISYSIFFKGEC